MNALWAHVILTVTGVVGLVVVQVTGHNDQTISGILGALIGGGAWGAIQRQQMPVSKE